jgi:hypothetical protein
MKNHCCSKVKSRIQEIQTQRFLLINQVLTWGNPHSHITQRRGDEETEGGEAISVKAEKRKAF